jgi:hypothetical protein
MLSAAANYGELIEAAFDMYRFALYKSLRWPLPDDPGDELQKGRNITDYLLGSPDPKNPPNEPKFTKSEEKGS